VYTYLSGFSRLSSRSAFINIAEGKLRIKEYTSPISGEIAMLVGEAVVFLHFANRYTYSMIKKLGRYLH